MELSLYGVVAIWNVRNRAGCYIGWSLYGVVAIRGVRNRGGREMG